MYDSKDLPKPADIEDLTNKDYLVAYWPRLGGKTSGIGIGGGTFEECLTLIYKCYKNYPANFRAAWEIVKPGIRAGMKTEELPKSADLTQSSGPYTAMYFPNGRGGKGIALGTGTFEHCLELIHRCYTDYPAPFGAAWLIFKSDPFGYKD